MLVTAVSTVRKHPENAFERTGVHSRSAAVALMMPLAAARPPGPFGGAVDTPTRIRSIAEALAWSRRRRGDCRCHATPAGRNWILTRGPTPRRVLGTACSQVRWQLPPMTIRSP